MKKLSAAAVLTVLLIGTSGCAEFDEAMQDATKAGANDGKQKNNKNGQRNGAGKNNKGGQQKAAKAPSDSGSSGVLEVTVTSTESGSGSVTYSQPDSDAFELSQETDASLPWTKTWENIDSLPLGWNMNAQQSGGGTLTCEVKLDGEVLASNESSGDYSVVTCAP